jgi:hypothetical protein
VGARRRRRSRATDQGPRQAHAARGARRVRQHAGKSRRSPHRHQLRLPSERCRALDCTNAIENVQGTIRRVTRT